MSKWRRAYQNTINVLGYQATFTRADGSESQSCKVAVRQVGRDQAEIINAFGVRAVALTVGESDLTVEPRKFDRFTLDRDGKVYVVQADPVTHHFGHRLYARAE